MEKSTPERTPPTGKRQRLRTLVAQAVGTLPGVGIVSGGLYAEAAVDEEIIVRDVATATYRIDDNSMSKFTEELRDTPQSITAIPQELLEDRAALTLNDALRNVPGITLGAGEMLYQGNTTNIRGFAARSDLFLDGMRDFGSYFRDPFNLERIEVLQGPSSMVFGRGSTGGVVNQASKVPLSTPLRRLSVNMGNASLRRATLDFNQPFEAWGEDAAVRVNLMRYHAGVPERNVTETEQYGIAPSLRLGLGDATRLTLSYLKQRGDSVPDYGLPWVGSEAAKVDRRNFYGFTDDYLDTDASISTLRLEHRVTGNVGLEVLVRYADYGRQVRLTEPQLVGSVGANDPLDGVMVDRFMFRSESTERMLQSQINVVASFETGNVQHSFVSGIEVGEESSSPMLYFGSGGLTSITDPVGGSFAGSVVRRLEVDTRADTVAAYALNTMKLGERWQFVAGTRWDSFDADYFANRFDASRAYAGSEEIAWKDTMTSYRAAVIYKPVEWGTIYLGWGTSFNPTVENMSMLDSGRAMSNRNAMLEPEENRSLELGVKWDLLNDMLTLDTALFRIEKTNARVPDPDFPAFNMLAGLQRADGFSVHVSGNLSRRISLTGGYMYLDTEEVEGAPGASNQGRPLVQAAKHNFSVWGSYSVTDRWEIGAGARYVDDRLARNTAIRGVPDYWAIDAMVGYSPNNHVALKLNLTNVTNEYYLDQLHTWHVIPGPGRGAVFGVRFTY